ncbi:hypothetical protein AC062_1918 [Pasteurellaceae bacterium NI1060]|nr:hypothetical protein AC062_1918 [Pasteurellaceae bacterium NI1060]
MPYIYPFDKFNSFVSPKERSKVGLLSYKKLKDQTFFVIFVYLLNNQCNK